MTDFSNDISFTTYAPSPTVTTAEFSYDGANPGNVTIRVYGAEIGHTYIAYASDPNSSGADDVVATTENFIMTITNVGGFPLPLTFYVVVADQTAGQTVATTIFTQSSTPQYPNEAGWAYDGDTTVSVTFLSEVGKFYTVTVDAENELSSSAIAGTGSLMTIDLDYSSIGPFVGAFTATLAYQQTVTI